MVLFDRKQPWGYNPLDLSLFSSAPAKAGTTMMTSTEGDLLIVPFGGSAPPAPTLDKNILGGKGVGLQTMGNIGIDVPPGFTLTTDVCVSFQDNGGLPDDVWDSVLENIRRIETDMGRKFGDTEQMPLLLSCRSGAAISMPGMMDTVLNVGLNSDTVKALAKATENPKFAYDSFRRLLDMFGDVVLGIPHEAFEKELHGLKQSVGVANDMDLSADQLQELCNRYLKVYETYKMKFPHDVYEQIRLCIKAVFGSWNSDRAIKYRNINNIQSLKGTACNLQTMVFGNSGETSGTGVAFSRDSGTGSRTLQGEYLVNAQGEDVVAGIRTPEPIATMKQALPEAYKQFMENINKLEHHFKDMQDVEFTVENGKLWMLQCRSGKRTGHAAVKIAVDFVNDGICTPEEAILKVDADHVRQVLHPTFSQGTLESQLYKDSIIARGLSGGPGAAVGALVFDSETAEASDTPVILVRDTTSPEDVGGMYASAGILTIRGGVTSHAAVIARSFGKPCICGCEDIEIVDGNKMVVKATGETFNEGDVISLNGSAGEVLRQPIALENAEQDGDFGTLLGWADAIEDSCKVLANADSGSDAQKALELGAQGIGLCRTEHMFFAPDRLPVVRRWILRDEGIDKIREFQTSDFYDLMKVMDGKPVTVRLLDPPLHEFLPKTSEVTAEFAKTLGYGDPHDLCNDIEDLHEENPMLGLRGCRLGICRPELTTTQVEALMNAAADLIEEKRNPYPRIMVPLVGGVAEFKDQALLVKETAEKVKKDRGIEIPYEIGTMIEVPRAALVSDEIAAATDPSDGKRLCSFFSYGTNDLTQMTMGISRDDAGEFISDYIEKGILEKDPFKTIDEDGVGWLLHLSAAKGRAVNPDLSLSVCGEHGGDPDSIRFFDKVGLDYVSCSPFRVPVARLAAGQAAVTRGIEANGANMVKKDRVTKTSPLSLAQ